MKSFWFGCVASVLALAGSGALVGCLGGNSAPPRGTSAPETLDWVLFAAQQGDMVAEPLPPETLAFHLRSEDTFAWYDGDNQEVVLRTQAPSLRVFVTRLNENVSPPPEPSRLTLGKGEPRVACDNFTGRGRRAANGIYATDGRRVFQVPCVETPPTLLFSLREQVFGGGCRPMLKAVPPEERSRVAAFLAKHFLTEAKATVELSGMWTYYHVARAMIAAFRRAEGLGEGAFDATCWERLRPRLPALPSAERWVALSKTGDRELTLAIRNPSARTVEVRGMPLFLGRDPYNTLLLPDPFLLAPGETRTIVYHANARDTKAPAPLRLRQVIGTPEGDCLFEASLDFPADATFTPSLQKIFEVLEACPPGIEPEPIPPEVLRASLVRSDGFLATVPALRLTTEAQSVCVVAKERRLPAIRFGEASLRPERVWWLDLGASIRSDPISVEGALPPEEINRPTKASLTYWLRDETGKVWSLAAERVYEPLPQAMREACWRDREADHTRRNPPYATAKDLPERPKTAHFECEGERSDMRLPPDWFSVEGEGKTLALTFRNPSPEPVTFDGSLRLEVGELWTRLRGKPIPDTYGRRSLQTLALTAFTLAPGETKTLRLTTKDSKTPHPNLHVSLDGSVRLGNRPFALRGTVLLPQATADTLIWEHAPAGH